jgi:F-type H+-transporting ATPase subunit b
MNVLLGTLSLHLLALAPAEPAGGGEGGGGIGAIAGSLGLNVPGFLWQLVNFLVLLFLLYLVLYKPILKMLDERTARIRDSLARADEVRRQSEQADADRQALLAETRREAETIRNRADEQAKRIIAEAEGRAKEAEARILAQAEDSSKQIRQQMLAEVRGQVADMVIGAVDRVTRSALDAQSQRSLIQQFLAESGNGRSGGTMVRP